MRHDTCRWYGLLVLMVFMLFGVSLDAAERPNVLFCIADDWGWPHAGAYGDKGVNTPAFDRVAREGVLFSSAYCASPSCTPSRSALLTGQPIWRLEEGGQLFGTLPAKYPVFPLLLRDAGYHVGWTGVKIWGPGNVTAGGRTEHPAGPRYTKHRLKRDQHPEGTSSVDPAGNFEQFLGERKDGQPFCFLYGSHAPHRGYKEGIGLANGKTLADAHLWGCFPDDDVARSDVLDYYIEVEHFDRQVGRLLDLLAEAGELDNTLVIVTSDHGMPFPRCKGNLYDSGTHVPMAIRWPTSVKSAGRAVADFVSLIDVAPTLLDAAGVDVPQQMTGRSLLPILASGRSGQVDDERDFVVTAFERHTWCRPDGVGYPMRAIQTHEWAYIRNYEPDRWPAGDPDFDSPHQGIFGDVDRGALRKHLLDNRDDPKLKSCFERAFGKRPAEELYDLERDPHQLTNLAGQPEYEEVRQRLATQLEQHLLLTRDPRVLGQAKWDSYPYYFKDYWKRAKSN